MYYMVLYMYSVYRYAVHITKCVEETKHEKYDFKMYLFT